MSHHRLLNVHATTLAAVTLCLTTFTPAAHALQITAGVDWSTNGGPVQSVVMGPASSGAVKVEGFTDTGLNYYSVFGDDSGLFGSRLIGHINSNITGTYNFSETYTASGGAASFNFHVMPGNLRLTNHVVQLIGTEQLVASYALNILMNGTNIWSSAAQMLESMSGITFSQGGTSLGGIRTGGQYTWGDYIDSLALGSFAAGDVFTIDYILTTTASGNYSNCSSFECIGATNVSIGDPFGVGGANSFNVTGASAAAVPEPTTLALLGMGLAGITITRRKQRSPTVSP